MIPDQERSQGSPTSAIPIRVARASSFHQDGQEQWAVEEDSEEDFSDPEDIRQPSPAITSTTQSPNTEQERANIWRDITDADRRCRNLEDFKADYEERLKRCCGPDGNDKNKTIFHWLPSQLWDGSISPNHLEWLVSTIISCDPLIILQRTNDVQKSNCLHIALEAKRFVLVRLICQQSLEYPAASLAVRETISQGNEYKENSLHMAIRQDEPDLNLIQFLVENADKEAITMQRRRRTSGDETEHLNTPLHDLVHIDRVFKKGYMKVLAQTVEKCPEALKISNRAKETPFLFHVSTRNRKEGEWADLEFVNPNFSPARRSNKRAGPSVSKDTNPKDKIAKVGSYLLDQCCSKFPYEEACICLYGDKEFYQNISFQPASPVDSRTEVAHAFLDFYPILSYVELTLVEPHASFGYPPGPSGTSLVPTSQSAQELRKKRSESVKSIFKWLRHQKKVQRILKLVVTDDGALPCRDSTIEDCLQGFDIRYLSWNKEDLCTDTLRSAGLSNVKELWLSWSGRNSVLHSWSCKETGLPKLSQLEYVHIEVRSGIESDRDTVNFKNFKRRLQKNTSELQFDPFRHGMTKKITAELEEELEAVGPKLKMQMLTWTGAPNYAVMARVNRDDPPPSLEVTISSFDARVNDYFKDIDNIREIKVDLSVPIATSEGKSLHFRDHREPGHRWIDAARRLATAVCKVPANKDRTSRMRPIKVAIIDDGVTPGHLSRPSALKDGWPFTGPKRAQSRSKPYYHSEKGHGTKMARLIQMICPYASLYIAKVDMHKDSDASVASSAAEAVKWAVEKQVDIISMSWTVKRVKIGTFDNGNGIVSLERAIQSAANQDILMFCAVQDGAHYEADEIFPSQSDTTKLMTVGSADETGERSTFVKKDSAKFLFPGEISLPSILEEKDKGSSVATAVAAGMAAMILWCAEYHSLETNQASTMATKAVPRADDHQEPEYAGPTASKPREPARRTAAEWDFRRDRRMSNLFNELKPTAADDRFVDITNVIDQVLRATDGSYNDVHGIQVESSCAGLFIEKCRMSLPVKLR